MDNSTYLVLTLYFGFCEEKVVFPALPILYKIKCKDKFQQLCIVLVIIFSEGDDIVKVRGFWTNRCFSQDKWTEGTCSSATDGPKLTKRTVVLALQCSLCRRFETGLHNSAILNLIGSALILRVWVDRQESIMTELATCFELSAETA